MDERTLALMERKHRYCKHSNAKPSFQMENDKLNRYKVSKYCMDCKEGENP